jgi:CRP-like cAMP-binding protein
MSDGNRLLAGLPPMDRQRLLAALKTVPLKHNQRLQQHDDPIKYVYFPNAGVCSLTMVMQDGRTVEVGTIGREGMVGIEAFLGSDKATAETIAQVTQPGDTVLMMPIEAFMREVERSQALKDAISRYSQAVMSEFMVSVACNTLHTVLERSCRWLLRAHDRVTGDRFRLSHEFLAVMLGVRRPTVSLAASTLQKAGLIRYTRGEVTVLDRAGLEGASCECYAVTRGYFDRAGFPSYVK